MSPTGNASYKVTHTQNATALQLRDRQTQPWWSSPLDLKGPKTISHRYVHILGTSLEDMPPITPPPLASPSLCPLFLFILTSYIMATRSGGRAPACARSSVIMWLGRTSHGGGHEWTGLEPEKEMTDGRRDNCSPLLAAVSGAHLPHQVGPRFLTQLLSGRALVFVSHL